MHDKHRLGIMLTHNKPRKSDPTLSPSVSRISYCLLAGMAHDSLHCLGTKPLFTKTISVPKSRIQGVGWGGGGTVPRCHPRFVAYGWWKIVGWAVFARPSVSQSISIVCKHFQEWRPNGRYNRDRRCTIRRNKTAERRWCLL